MTIDELKQLYHLLVKWIQQPNWITSSKAWANIVETKRQVLIDLREFGITEKDLE